MDLTLGAEAAGQLAAIAKLWGGMPEGDAAEHVISRFHAAYVKNDGAMPPGWTLREDISQGDLEDYYTFLKEEDSAGLVQERGAMLRAAIKAGWITAEGKLNPVEVRKLKPAQAVAAKNALDSLYVRLMTDDPNS